jgi:hypothetical protein
MEENQKQQPKDSSRKGVYIMLGFMILVTILMILKMAGLF